MQRSLMVIAAALMLLTLATSMPVQAQARLDEDMGKVLKGFEAMRANPNNRAACIAEARQAILERTGGRCHDLDTRLSKIGKMLDYVATLPKNAYDGQKNNLAQRTLNIIVEAKP